MRLDQALVEVTDPHGAINHVEAQLEAAGFFRPDADQVPGTAADVYLGYAISEAMRRSDRVRAPEPIDLPSAAVRLRSSAGSMPSSTPGPYHVGDWERTWEGADYVRAVKAAREAIGAGEVYQVNLVQHLSATFQGDPAGVAAALAQFGPRHARPLLGHDWAIISASPELFLARRGRRVWTMPIKGTRPSGDTAALRASAKDAAEHTMIVDLERNDLGRICEPGSVAWPELMRARSMVGVEHLVSLVEGRIRDDVGWAATISALFPGGSVTGAPKIAALDQISLLEPVGRGAAMGALGTVWANGDFDLTLTIRTFAIQNGMIHFWVGGGVVWDSDPMAELEESWVKARPLLDAIAAGSRRAVAA
jgi:para-aminobenzoate synthetase component I